MSHNWDYITVAVRTNRQFLCGAGAGLVETCITYPFHKVILRQQIHGYNEWDDINGQASTCLL